MEIITIYTQPGCPKCAVLKKKLQSKNVPYQECQNINVMIDLGIKNVPALQTGEEILPFNDAVKYVNQI